MATVLKSDVNDLLSGEALELKLPEKLKFKSFTT